jgi:beta-glucosidase
VERTHGTAEDKALMRKVAADSIVLLKNKDNLLPLKLNEHNIKKIAIIGPNAKLAVISGGGSAALKPNYVVTPYEGIFSALPEGVQPLYAEGCQGLPSIFYSGSPGS